MRMKRNIFDREDDELPSNFIKKPKAGNKVKVYYRMQEPKYGIVIRVDKLSSGREVAILQISKEEFELHDCDFCLDSGKIDFE